MEEKNRPQARSENDLLNLTVRAAAALLSIICLTCALWSLISETPKWVQIIGTLPALYIGAGLFFRRLQPLERDMESSLVILHEAFGFLISSMRSGERQLTLAGRWLVGVAFIAGFTALVPAYSWGVSLVASGYDEGLSFETMVLRSVGHLIFLVLMIVVSAWFPYRLFLILPFVSERVVQSDR